MSERSQASGEPRVSVIVPCLNEAPYIESLLEAIRLQDRPPFEVIVVDGGSTDGTQGVVARYCLEHPNPPVTIVVQPNGRIPVSLNAGIRAASRDVIARLDAHSRPRPDYLGRLVGLLLESDAGVTGGRWEIEPGRPSRMGHAIAWAVQHPLGAGNAAYRLAAGDGRIRPVDTVPFGCFRKAVWAELGGFNETLQANEDYEFNYRVRRSGRRVLLDPGAVSIYAARGTLGQLARQYFRYGWWKLAMLERYPRALRWRQAVPMLFVGRPRRPRRGIAHQRVGPAVAGRHGRRVSPRAGPRLAGHRTPEARVANRAGAVPGLHHRSFRLGVRRVGQRFDLRLLAALAVTAPVRLSCGPVAHRCRAS